MPVPIGVRLWVRAGANQCRFAMLSLPKFGAPSGFENPGVKKQIAIKFEKFPAHRLQSKRLL